MSLNLREIRRPLLIELLAFAILFTPALPRAGSPQTDTCLTATIQRLDSQADSLRKYRTRLYAHLVANDYEELDPREFVYLLHGTTERQAAHFMENLLDGKKQFFTTTSPATAKLFADRTVVKYARADEGTAYVLLALPRERLDWLKQNRLMVTRNVPDMPSHYEIVFEPGAKEILEREGYFLQIPKNLIEETP